MARSETGPSGWFCPITRPRLPNLLPLPIRGSQVAFAGYFSYMIFPCHSHRELVTVLVLAVFLLSCAPVPQGVAQEQTPLPRKALADLWIDVSMVPPSWTGSTKPRAPTTSLGPSMSHSWT